jgi:hypothetical protein
VHNGFYFKAVSPLFAAAIAFAAAILQSASFQFLQPVRSEAPKSDNLRPRHPLVHVHHLELRLLSTSTALLDEGQGRSVLAAILMTAASVPPSPPLESSMPYHQHRRWLANHCSATLIDSSFTISQSQVRKTPAFMCNLEWSVGLFSLFAFLACVVIKLLATINLFLLPSF